MDISLVKRAVVEGVAVEPRKQYVTAVQGFCWRVIFFFLLNCKVYIDKEGAKTGQQKLPHQKEAKPNTANNKKDNKKEKKQDLKLDPNTEKNKQNLPLDPY